VVGDDVVEESLEVGGGPAPVALADEPADDASPEPVAEAGPSDTPLDGDDA
jgi:hypothetical protein